MRTFRPRGDYVVAVKDGSFSDRYNGVHHVKTGVTRCSRDDTDLNRPEVAALFGVSANANRRAEPDWLLDEPARAPDPDWLLE